MRGLVAVKKIPADQNITVYPGIVGPYDEKHKSEYIAEYKDQDGNRMTLDAEEFCKEQTEPDTLIQVHNFIRRATEKKTQSIAMAMALGGFANHSPFPNAEINIPRENYKWKPTEEERRNTEQTATIRTIRKITAGTQILVNYGSTYNPPWYTLSQQRFIAFATQIMEADHKVTDDRYELPVDADRKHTLRVFRPGASRERVPVIESSVYEANEGNPRGRVTIEEVVITFPTLTDLPKAVIVAECFESTDTKNLPEREVVRKIDNQLLANVADKLEALEV